MVTVRHTLGRYNTITYSLSFSIHHITPLKNASRIGSDFGHEKNGQKIFLKKCVKR